MWRLNHDNAPLFYYEGLLRISLYFTKTYIQRLLMSSDVTFSEILSTFLA